MLCILSIRSALLFKMRQNFNLDKQQQQTIMSDTEKTKGDSQHTVKDDADPNNHNNICKKKQKKCSSRACFAGLLFLVAITLISASTLAYSVDKFNKERTVANDITKATYETCFCEYVNWTDTTATLHLSDGSVQYADWGSAEMQVYCNRTGYQHLGEQTLYTSKPANETCYRSLKDPNQIVSQIPLLKAWIQDSSITGFLTSLLVLCLALAGIMSIVTLYDIKSRY